MEPLELEALLIRHNAVMKTRPFDDPWKNLEMVLIPPEDVLNASLQRAEEKGISALVYRLLRARKEVPLNSEPKAVRGAEGKRLLQTKRRSNLERAYTWSQSPAEEVTLRR